MNEGGPVRIRRVGFRHGTDVELAAMHLVESEIEAERRPGRPAQPLESYIAFARNLPSQFDDHTWLATTSDDIPVGCSACWSNAAGDAEIVESYVYVRPAWRRQGVGRLLWRAVVDAAVHERRSSLTWETFDAVPAGEAFARRAGGRIARVDRASELLLADVDWELVRSWVDGCRGRHAGYGLEFWAGDYPAELLGDVAALHHIMQTAPRDALDIGDVVIDAEQVAELDRARREAGRERWTIFVRDPQGRFVGGTEITFEPWEPAFAFQQNTGIDPAHRELGLARWAKAAMLERVRDDRREVERIRTDNAFSNAPMLAINDALGFGPVEVRTEWQAAVDEAAGSWLSQGSEG